MIRLRQLTLAAVWLLWGLLTTRICLAQESDHSVARQWNEALLEAIRNDFARPTVHARNLFHTSVALYDSWAAYDDVATPFLFGRTVNDFTCNANDIATPNDLKRAREETMSYAAYRVLSIRFENSPGRIGSQQRFDALMADLGFDTSFGSADYTDGNPAALGNHIANCIIAFGLSDGANEGDNYSNTFYERVNPPLVPAQPGNPDIVDPNRWQPLALDLFIDQAGNPIAGPPRPFLSPEWGAVFPFALGPEQRTNHTRDGDTYHVYHDPGVPPLIDPASALASEAYRFGFSLVATWSSHLDPTDGVMWDISPGASGNVPELPVTTSGYPDFYDLLEGGDPGAGRAINPATGLPYQPQVVPRGDYTRVLAEFWADGPDSETPPGHWFTILNYVVDHPAFTGRYRGVGPVLDPLEWDVKAYLALGGAMHDAAIAAWGIKGWYDYVRPVSAIRFMADRGQSTSPDSASYAEGGLPLIPGYIELVRAGDPLADGQNENIGKIKLRAWRGPNYVDDPATTTAGVDWILAEDWWPYQRPTFVTPPFAGYVSGHSTFSRAAAELLTILTGDAYFPGGLGEFYAPKDEFLVFEDGPSVDVTLQWATYRDASDQTSLSRIWGGIHPPADDIPGRHIGIQVGIDAFQKADAFFSGQVQATPAHPSSGVAVFPNPVRAGAFLNLRWEEPDASVRVTIVDVIGRNVLSSQHDGRSFARIPTSRLAAGLYVAHIRTNEWETNKTFVVVH